MHNVFLSFAMEDKKLVDLFRAQAKNRNLPLEFRDHSVKEPFEGAWKNRCEEKMRRCSLVICLVGDETYRSAPVNWEIRKAVELGKGLIAVDLVDGLPQLPEALGENSVVPVPWKMDKIMDEIRGAVA